MKSMILAGMLMAGGLVSPQAADAHSAPHQHGYDHRYHYVAPPHYARAHGHHGYCVHGKHWHRHAKHWRKHHGRTWHDYRHWYGDGYAYHDRRHDDGRGHRDRRRGY